MPDGGCEDAKDAALHAQDAPGCLRILGRAKETWACHCLSRNWPRAGSTRDLGGLRAAPWLQVSQPSAPSPRHRRTLKSTAPVLGFKLQATQSTLIQFLRSHATTNQLQHPNQQTNTPHTTNLPSLLSILLHPILHPRPGVRRRLVELLLSLVAVLERGVLARHMAALLDARPRHHPVDPRVQVRELVQRDARPVCPVLLAFVHGCK